MQCVDPGQNGAIVSHILSYLAGNLQGQSGMSAGRRRESCGWVGVWRARPPPSRRRRKEGRRWPPSWRPGRRARTARCGRRRGSRSARALMELADQLLLAAAVVVRALTAGSDVTAEDGHQGPPARLRVIARRRMGRAVCCLTPPFPSWATLPSSLGGSSRYSKIDFAFCTLAH